MGRMWTAGDALPTGEEDHHRLPAALMRVQGHRAASVVENLLSTLTHAVDRAKICTDDPYRTALRRSATVPKP
jgi:hypothetical protein